MSVRLPKVSVFGGAALLALGVLAALRVLPEWRAVPPRPVNAVARARALVAEAGGDLASPRLSLEGRRLGTSFERAYQLLRGDARAWLESAGGAAAWTVRGTLTIPGAGGARSASVAFDPSGRPVAVESFRGGSVFGSEDAKAAAARRAFVEKIRTALADGRALGTTEEFAVSNITLRTTPLAPAPGRPDESLVVQDQGAIRFAVARQLHDPELARAFEPDEILKKLYRLIPSALLLVAVAILFGVLLYKRRLAFRIAIALTLLAAVYEAAGGLTSEELASGGFVFVNVVFRIASLLYLLALWAVAESLLRDTVSGFTTSLDAFVARRLGPRGGVAILAGLGAGAAATGIGLLAFSAASLAAGHGAQPTGVSFVYPLFASQKGPFYEGVLRTALLVLAIAAFRFVLPRRWAGPAAALVVALYLSLSVPLAPWSAAFALSLALAIVFLLIFEAHGLASLLVAAVSASLLRDALVAARFVEGNVLEALLAIGPLGLLAIAGIAGVRGKAEDEEGRLDAPEYVRRIESERRVKYEMDLLSRMQLSLLPEKPPAVPGLELAVKTVLATEAGGDLYDFIADDAGALWIAAGDVSGHGYSCGIQQAMVMAALSSLVKAGRSPAEVLAEIDRVLRTGRSGRLFTSLALLKLEPKTGDGVVANAGHPYPILLDEQGCREIAGSGLPLGQGPRRIYEDVALTLPKGGALVLASDGLYEGPDLVDAPYGYDRPRDVLTAVSLWRRPADAIVEALYADWRRHVGDGSPPDDTTILVVKRPLF